MVGFSKKLMEKLRVEMEDKIKNVREDMTSSVAELSDEMNRQFELAEKRHRQMQDKVSAVEHKLDSGMAGLNRKIARIEEQLKKATDAQAATLAQLQTEIRGARSGSSGDAMPQGPRVRTDWRPSGPYGPGCEERSPYSSEKYSTMMYFPFPVTPDLKKKTFTRVAEEVMPGDLRADAVRSLE